MSKVVKEIVKTKTTFDSKSQLIDLLEEKLGYRPSPKGLSPNRYYMLDKIKYKTVLPITTEEQLIETFGEEYLTKERAKGVSEKKLRDRRFHKLDFANLTSEEKLPDKDLSSKKNIRREKIKKIDLHGYTLEEANGAIEQFIQKCFDESVTKIIVITGKGLRSKNLANPYLSKDLSILKYSVPEFIESKKNLVNMITEITDAKVEDGGSCAFYVYLKNKFKFK